MALVSLAERGRPINILIVEDNKTDALLAQRCFKESKVPSNIVVAEDGAVALQKLQAVRDGVDPFMPDFILLDLNLPKVKGISVLKFAKQDPVLRHIPVLVLTGSNRESDIQECYANHVNGYMIKPDNAFDLKEMVQAIEIFWFATMIVPPAKEDLEGMTQAQTA